MITVYRIYNIYRIFYTQHNTNLSNIDTNPQRVGLCILYIDKSTTYL